VYEERKSAFPIAFLAGSAVVLFLVAGAYFWTQRSASDAAGGPRALPWGSAEQAYAEKIHFLDLKMSRAANLLNQEITYLDGILANDGDRTIQEIEVTVEFRDMVNQVVLRETQRPLGLRPKPLLPLQRREFQLSFEHVPDDWNRQYPGIRTTGLVLE